MSNTQPSVFKFEEAADIRVIMQNEEPWFIAKDICDVLGLSNVTEALRPLDEDEKSNIRNSDVRDFEVPNRGLAIVSESGLYALVIRSNKPNARKFRKWVTSEVLPTIHNNRRALLRLLNALHGAPVFRGAILFGQRQQNQNQQPDYEPDEPAEE